MPRCLSAVTVMGLAACALPAEPPPADEPIEATSETEQSLVVSNWSAPAQISSTTAWYPQIATLAGTTYMVHSGPRHDLSWRQMVGEGWTEPVVIPGQTTTQRVSLAAFNGFLYMVRAASSPSTTLAMSRFSPSTGQWTGSWQLSHTSVGTPALAAYQGKLHLIGIEPGTQRLWHATMTPDEAITNAAPMEGHYSASRVSAAVYKCKLYIAHRAGTGTAVVYNSFDGNSWIYDQTIPAGPGGAAITAFEPVIAERGGFLHLLHRPPTTATVAPVWWTYFDGVSWPSEVTIPNTSTYWPPVLVTGGAGLVAVVTSYNNSIAASLQYTQPLGPRPPRECIIILPPPIDIGAASTP